MLSCYAKFKAARGTRASDKHSLRSRFFRISLASVFSSKDGKFVKLFQFLRFLRNSSRRIWPMNASSIQRQQLANNLNISNEQNNRSSSARNVGSTDSEPSNNLSVLSNQSHLKRSESVDSIYHGPYIIIYPADISEDDFLERLSVYLKSAEHSIFSSDLSDQAY